jgi:hypothetical protein
MIYGESPFWIIGWYTSSYGFAFVYPRCGNLRAFASWDDSQHEAGVLVDEPQQMVFRNLIFQPEVIQPLLLVVYLEWGNIGLPEPTVPISWPLIQLLGFAYLHDPSQSASLAGWRAVLHLAAVRATQLERLVCSLSWRGSNESSCATFQMRQRETAGRLAPWVDGAFSAHFPDEKEFRRSVFGYGHFLPPANTEHMTTLRCRAAMSFLLNSTLWSFVAGAVLISSWAVLRIIPLWRGAPIPATRGAFVHTTVQDIQYALRLMQRNAGLTLIALSALAISIGANTTIFSVIYGVLLRPLPFPHSEHLIRC